MGYEKKCPRPVAVRRGKATWCEDCAKPDDGPRQRIQTLSGLATAAELPASVTARQRDFDDPRRTDL